MLKFHGVNKIGLYVPDHLRQHLWPMQGRCGCITFAIDAKADKRRRINGRQKRHRAYAHARFGQLDGAFPLQVGSDRPLEFDFPVFDDYFDLFASRQPDPVLRAQEVNEFLRLRGIPATTQVISGFLASQVTLQRQQTLSVALLGIRDTVNLTAAQSRSTQVDPRGCVKSVPS